MNNRLETEEKRIGSVSELSIIAADLVQEDHRQTMSIAQSRLPQRGVLTKIIKPRLVSDWLGFLGKVMLEFNLKMN